MRAVDFYILPEVAEILKASIKTVRRRIEEGKIPSFKEGGRVCVLASDLDAYLERVFRTTVPR